jgi:hypothetical protein
VLGSNARLRSEIIPGGKKNKNNKSNTDDDTPHSPAPMRISWACLLKRVFEIDIEHYPQCGGKMKIIAAILKSSVIAKILKHLDLHPRVPPRAPAQILDPFEPPDLRLIFLKFSF